MRTGIWNFGVFFGLALVSPSVVRSGAPANTLNPKISVIGDFVGQSGTKNQTGDGFSVREIELGFQAEVDPYAKADVFVGGLDDKGHAPELEEAYVTLPALPYGLQVRGGKFRVNFGRLNGTHSHEYPQVDTPLALTSFLGAEGMDSTGAELSRVFNPFGLYTETAYAVLRDFGAADSPASATTQVTDVNGHVVNVAVAQDQAATSQRGRSYAHVAKVRFYRDLTDTTNVDLGVSGALRQPQAMDQRQLAAVDLTFRWKPLSQGVYHSVTWRSEALYSRNRRVETFDPVTGAEALPLATVNARGAYSYLELQPAMRWRFGVRGDYVEDPDNRVKDIPHITRAYAPYVTFTLTEFNRFRIQYERKCSPQNGNENLGFFQWTIVLGPHGAHPF
jgi:hypothetical protein